jgi:hypothetical protein
MSRPRAGLSAAETTKPKEKAPAVMSRDQPNSMGDRREEQREGGARIDAHRHGDESHGDDDPAIEERQARRQRGNGRPHGHDPYRFAGGASISGEVMVERRERAGRPNIKSSGAQ